jgi:hypothetical protein
LIVPQRYHYLVALERDAEVGAHVGDAHAKLATRHVRHCCREQAAQYALAMLRRFKSAAELAG